MIPYGRQDINEADIEAVVNVLRSDFLTQGPAVERFERAVADYCGAKYAVAVCNATAALHIACLSAGLGEGDCLWTTPITFVASANCALYCGAKVDFVDIDPVSANISVVALSEKLADARATGKPLPKVVIPVHLAGASCDMAALKALSDDYGFILIEDASHAIGGQYQDLPVGSCAYSAMTVFSFHPVKIVTTGEGGMVLTNSAALYQQLTLLRSHGITRDPALMTKTPDGPWAYEQIALGFNYRMTDIQAALGASQMQRIDAFVCRRNTLATQYDEAFSALSLQLPAKNASVYSAYHLYSIRLKPSGASAKTQSVRHRQVFEALRAASIGVNLHYIPIHTQPYYQGLGFRQGDFPEAERYYIEAISLPLYPGLTDEAQALVINAVAQALSGV